MGVFDQAARFAAHAEPAFLLARLRSEFGLDLAWRRWFPTRTIPLPGGPDRDADLVGVCDTTDNAVPAWVLIFEFQSQRLGACEGGTEHDRIRCRY